MTRHLHSPRLRPVASHSLWKALFLAVLGLTAVACITINVYFPEAAVRDLSEKIEDAVALEAARIGEGDSEASDSGDESASFQGQEAQGWRAVAGQVLGAVLDATAPDALAQAGQGVAAPEITNPAIRKIIDSRAKRVAVLNRHKASGVLGESKEALVEVRALDSLELRDRAAVQKLVRDENADRERMFREIAAATNADLSQLSRIRETYAETLRAKAAASHWIQLPDGTWRQK